MAPHLSQSGHRSKDPAPLRDMGGAYPLVKSGFDPRGNRYRANVTTFANQIHHGPTTLAHLDIVQLQTDPVLICENRSQTAWPTWRSRPWRGYCHHQRAGALPNFALRSTNCRTGIRAA